MIPLLAKTNLGVPVPFKELKAVSFNFIKGIPTQFPKENPKYELAMSNLRYLSIGNILFSLMMDHNSP
jgi:hypothetical protein